MHILLINTNPVVSRLLVLCTRDEAMELDEVTSLDSVERESYDVVFVDEASYGRDVADLLSRFASAKKVFISYRNDAMRGFDSTIKKPFLPSQIIELIQDIRPVEEGSVIEEPIEVEKEEESEENIAIFSLETEDENVAEAPLILDGEEIDKIKALLEMDDEIPFEDEVLDADALEARKIEVIKEQLIADGLEIVDEKEIVEELSIGLDGSLHTVEKADKASKKEKTKSKKKKNKSKKLKFTEENMEHIEDAVEMAMASMTKKQMKKLLKGKDVDVTIKLEGKN